MNLPPTRLAALALLATLVAATPSAQTYTLPTSVVSAGGTTAAGNAYTLDGSVGYVAGFSSSTTYALGTGFWYQAPALVAPRSAFAEALPPLALALPGSPVAPGAKLPMTVTFALGPDGPASFGYWAEVVLPDGTVLGPAVGPSTALVTVGTAVTLAFRQGVPASAAPGVYTYTMYAGTYPDEVLAVHAVPFTVAPSSRVEVLPAGVQTGARGAVRDREAGRELPPASARDGVVVLHSAPLRDDRWLAYDAEGRPLVAGAVIDFRFVEGRDVAAASPSSVTTSSLAGAEVPAEITLAPAYPNPVSSRATVRFGLPAAQVVRLTVFDALGRLVAVLLDDEHAAGWHEATFDGSGLASGVYLYRLEAGPFAQTRRLLLAK
jgi:hypothetical protein